MQTTSLVETNQSFQGNMECAFVIKVKKGMWSLVFTSLISSCLHFCLHAS